MTTTIFLTCLTVNYDYLIGDTVREKLGHAVVHLTGLIDALGDLSSTYVVTNANGGMVLDPKPIEAEDMADMLGTGFYPTDLHCWGRMAYTGCPVFVDGSLRRNVFVACRKFPEVPPGVVVANEVEVINYCA